MLHSIVSGKPQVLIPPNFHKIDLSAVRRNIEKQQYNFSGDSEYKWWLQYLKYLQLVKDDKDSLFDYANREADWLLPKLMNLQKTENSNADIENQLLEMLDRELDDHEVVLSKPKPKKSKKCKEKG